MKILLIYPFPPPVHGFSIMGTIALRGLSAGNDVTAIDAALNKNFHGNKLPPIGSPKRLLLVAKRLISDLKILFSDRYDIIYMGIGMGFRGIIRYAPYMLAARMRKIPYVLHTHDSTLKKTYETSGTIRKKILRNLFKHAGGIIVLGQSLRYLAEGLIDDDKIFVCENAVEDFVYASPEEIRHKKERRPPVCRLLFFTNIMRAKGIIEMIDAFGATEDTVLDLAGAIEPDREVEDKLESLCRQYPGRICYHGPVYGRAKHDLYLNSDILVLPSKNEGQSLSILEAYSCGCAVITDEQVGGLKDIFKNDVNGITCVHDRVSSIVDAIARCRAQLDRFTDHNFDASARYSEKQFTERLEKILQTILQQ